ncbi:MAG: hypothetical protein IPO40_24615 [Fibrobacteres bacterium]|nr:hypothetical protein [Fibrobacterota bacterium]
MTTLTTLNPNDSGQVSRTVINNNFEQLDLSTSSNAGGLNDFDSTKRIVQESYQKAEYPGHYAELQRLIWRDKLAKAIIAFQDGVDGNVTTPKSKAWLVAHNLSNGTQSYANFGAFPATVYGPNTTPAQSDYFYLSEATGTFYRWDNASTTNNATIAAGSWVVLSAIEELYGPRHQHFSIETTDDGGDNLYTRLAVQYDQTIPLLSFVNSNYRFYSGTFGGQSYGNLTIDGPIFNSNDFQFYPTADNVSDHKNLVSNNTKGFRIQKLSQSLTGVDETTISALGSNHLFLTDNLIVPSGAVGVGTLPATGFNLDVARNDGITAGERTIARLTRDGTTSLHMGYRADGANPTGLFIRATNSLPLIFGTTGVNEAVSVNNSGNLGVGTNSANTPIEVSKSDTNTTITTGNNSAIRVTNTNTTNDNMSEVAFTTNDTGGTNLRVASVVGVNISHTVGAMSGALAFLTRSAGTFAERMRLSAAGFLGLGTNNPTAMLDVNSDIIRIRTAKTPASASATGNAGDICWDSGFIYICVATNTWERAPIASW